MADPQDELDRDILTLHGEGLTDHEISQKLGRPRRTIGHRIRRMGLTSNTLRNTRSAGHPTTASAYPVQDLALDRISNDAATQMREQLSHQTIDEYAEAMQQGDNFPPIVVFQAGDTYWTADGWHRVRAARQLGLAILRGEVRPGGLDDAIDYACGANARHGLRPTIEDRRKAIRTQLERHPERSDREIARVCGCSPTTVGTYRAELEAQRQPLPPPVQLDRQTAKADEPAPLPSGVQLDTPAANPTPARVESERPPTSKAAAMERLPQRWEAVQAPMDASDALQAHLDPEQITDMTPIFRRRELTSDELEEATRSLAEGEELPAICEHLGVTPATLRQQVLQTLWDCWTAAHRLPQSRCPQALDF